MPLDFQNLAAVAAVAVAALYLAWRGLQLIRAERVSGCGSACSGCPSSAPAEQTPVVQIAATKKR